MFTHGMVLGLTLLPSVAFARAIDEGDADSASTEAAPGEPAFGDSTGEVSAPNTIFLEAGGAGLVYSANYDYRVLRQLSVRVGLGLLPVCLSNKCETYATFPVSLLGLAGGINHHFEYGFGATFTTLPEMNSTLYFLAEDDVRFWTLSMGYRYQPPTGDFFARATLVGMFRMTDVADWVVVPGASFGFSF